MNHLNKLIKLALKEDIGRGDITSDATISAFAIVSAKIVAKENLVPAGTDIAKLVFKAVDKKIRIKIKIRDGRFVKKGTVLAELKGRARSLLAAERTALNFLQHLSGIATLTRKFATRVKGTRVKILDTRKTLPGYRFLEKYAVRMGGGANHRMGLYDAYLIKNNHIAIAGSVAFAISAARESGYAKKVEVEVRNFSELKEALAGGADVIMLDNFSPKMATMAKAMIGRMAKIEVSGGINLSNVRRFAKAGVDFISVGAITHSAPAADIHMII